jgi:preprotein translocase subunit SecG
LEGALNFAQIMISVVLVIVILLQVRDAGGGIFGSGQASYRTRRGVEKTLFQATIVLGAVFVIVSILSAQLL